ncbi:hypothetical protein ACU4GD_24855 [Cupriavidus basilensis]
MRACNRSRRCSPATARAAGWVLKFHVPALDQLVIKTAPIVAQPKAYEAVLKLDLSIGGGHRHPARPR